jgi:RNA polymerase sigma-70 factor (ECF subfamily)
MRWRCDPSSSVTSLICVGSIARLDPSDDFIDETLQLLRHKLLSGDDPRLASYLGRSPFEAWLRLVATRTALDQLRARGRRRERGMELAAGLIGLDDAPENRAFENSCARLFERALASAVKTLSARDRNVMRLHFAEGSNIDAIGRVYGVNRATVARWIARCRERFFQQVRLELKRELGSLGESEFDSLLRMVHDELDISLTHLFVDLTSDAVAAEVAVSGVAEH